MSRKIKVAILGSGNIGLDLMMKIVKASAHLEMGALVGIDPESEGLKKARYMDIQTTSAGIDGLRKMTVYKDIGVVFDATSAKAHAHHNTILQQDGKKVIDLTPAAIGSYAVPAIDSDACINDPNVNMVTCGGQAVIPMIYAVKQATDTLIYGEIVSSISSLSAGPGTRANIDEFTETTARAIRTLTGAKNSKAIIILNPADPPIMMRCTIYTLTTGGSAENIQQSVENMVQQVQQYVPRYTLKQQVQFDTIDTNDFKNMREIVGDVTGKVLKSTIFLEVKGNGDWFPEYAGNLDIMTSAGKAVAETWAKHTM